VALTKAMLMVPRWRFATKKWRHKRAYERKFYHRIARGFVAHVEQRGTPSAQPGTLYVCNHISWLDIPVLASVLDTEFIAKDDVKDWPLFGKLSARTRTLFVSRTNRQETQRQIDAIGAALSSGVNLTLFPEGTTSDGSTVMPFFSSLFAAAAQATIIHPLVIGYRRRGGGALGDYEMAQIGWTGDEALVPNAAMIARMKIEAVVIMLDPIAPHHSEDRRSLAARCHAEISAGYAALRAENRSA
jgi:lyso-ornithine lipid O-acyltransferase